MTSMDNSSQQIPMGQKTVGEYLFDCLKQEGITEIFGVPGDYNFTLLDALQEYNGIRFYNGRNELNAGYAADGYARIKGISALITTFGVGELSATNAIAGANSEHVPIIHIVGSPPEKAQKERKLMHHTLMDGNFDVFRKVYEPLTAYTTIVTADNARMEIPAAIRIAKERRKPVYLVVADDVVAKPITGREVPASPLPASNQDKLLAAVEHVRRLLEPARQPVILVDVKAMRFGLQTAVRELANTMNVPVATMMYGKGTFDETHPNYIGVYAGTFGSSEVQSIVENSDCVIAVGLVWSDTNTANFTAKLNPHNTIEVQPTKVKIAESQYPDVRAADILQEMQKLDYRSQSKPEKISFPYEEITGSSDEPLRAENYFPRFQRMLKENDIVIAETGTFYYGMSQVKLPANTTYIMQGGWQSIGYATPAAYGASIAAPDRRVLLFTGDGSMQLTAQEISSMLYYGCKPIIFVLNNDGYTIERYLNVEISPDEQNYNDIPNWSYTKLAEAFGGELFTKTVRTNEELDEAITQAEQEYAEKLCLIEMIAADPMDAPEYMHRIRNHKQEQKK
ncbi:thiamine pyrophosphate-binding protein [Bacillus sp. FJAT-18017]|uniref:alpha-keto acid decarboxylase family protein n=1 Tax=Bacillus sp. FJAT-18017 TaxID=1705566 RepID=UPI0006AF5601|nr:thiamine pyrophosphate-binding protein [Bacillus sp. FJAT-18017]ALC89289.1 thiamine pyrophosphate-binding protein [Bacillus sp. FJAT-18017]